MNDFENHAYLDDVAMTGDHDEETVSKAWKLKDTVSPAYFNVTKFKSYPPHLTEPFGVAARNDPFKILGLGFDPITDSSSNHVNLMSTDKKNKSTKRTLQVFWPDRLIHWAFLHRSCYKLKYYVKKSTRITPRLTGSNL
jgi:hypothetical protein